MMPVSFLRTAKRFFDFGDMADGEMCVQTNIVKTTHDLLQKAGMNDAIPFIAPFIRDIDSEWTVMLADLSGDTYDIDPHARILYLDNNGLPDAKVLSSPYFMPRTVLGLIEGLRMVRHVEWLDGALEKYHPESVLRLGRICVADTVTQMIACAFAVKAGGTDILWKHILCGDYSHMARQFSRIYEKLLTSCQYDEIGEAYKQAMAGAFNSWFSLESGVIACDHNSLDLMDAMMADNISFGYKSIEPAAVTCLTLQSGGGSSYIEPALLKDIVKSPYYVAVTDPINQTHLMQLMHDMQCITVGHVAFHDTKLAARFSENVPV